MTPESSAEFTKHHSFLENRLRSSLRSMAEVCLLAFAGLVATPANLQAQSNSASRPHVIDVIYWGSDDCSWCTYWESGLSGMEQAFRESAAFSRLRYARVKNARLSQPFAPDDFPEATTWLRLRFLEGTYAPPRIRPAWSVFIGQRHLKTYFGTTAWAAYAVPAIEQLTAAATRSPEALEATTRELFPAASGGPPDVGDPRRLPYVDGNGQRAYQEWLRRTPPRAFAVGIDGAWGRGKTAAAALAYCERYSKNKCELYAVDQTVVWQDAYRK